MDDPKDQVISMSGVGPSHSGLLMHWSCTGPDGKNKGNLSVRGDNPKVRWVLDSVELRKRMNETVGT